MECDGAVIIQLFFLPVIIQLFYLAENVEELSLIR